MSGIGDRNGVTRRTIVRKRARARDPVMDTEKIISNTDFKNQLNDTSDIQRAFEIAPPSKRAMYQASFDNSVGKYFTYPGRRIPSENLSQVFYSSLSLKTEIQPEPLVDAAGLLLPLDPTLKVTNSVRMYLMDAPEYASSSTAKKKAETFDKLVQGLCKSRYKALRRRNKTETPKITINSEQVAHSSPDLELVTNEEDLQNVQEGYSTPLVKTDDSEHVEALSTESETPNDENASSLVDLYMIDESYEEGELVSLHASHGEPVFAIVNSGDLEKVEPGDDYYVVSPDVYDVVEYVDDIVDESQEFDSGGGELESEEVVTESPESVLNNENEETEHQEPEEEEGVLHILEEEVEEMSDQVMNLEDYDYTEEASQEPSPDVELVADVNVEDIVSDSVLELDADHDTDISQPQFYYSGTTCSANVAVGGGGSDETVPEIYTNTTEAQPISFLIFME